MKYLILAFLTLLLLFDCTPPETLEEGQAKLLYVVDGDTIAVRYQGKEERVRLIGIDALENRRNSKAYRQAKRSGRDVKEIISTGRSARKHLKSIIQKGSRLTLEFDIERRDRYQRLLVYAYRGNGEMINEKMVRDGYAKLLTIPPNVRHARVLRKAYNEAREAKRGLWSAN